MAGLTPEAVDWTRQALAGLTAWASNVEGGGPPIPDSMKEEVVGNDYHEAWIRTMHLMVGYMNLARRLAARLSQETAVTITDVTRELGDWVNSGEASL